MFIYSYNINNLCKNSNDNKIKYSYLIINIILFSEIPRKVNLDGHFRSCVVVEFAVSSPRPPPPRSASRRKI